MIIGFALLANLLNILMILVLNLFLTQAIYYKFIRPATSVRWIAYLAGLGTYTALLILGALWTAYMGNGIIEDIEFFEYFKY